MDRELSQLTMDRELSDLLQHVQYPHPVATGSFQTPNFELMASILCWLAQRLDPSIPIHDQIGTEDDRVQFLNGIASGLATKMNVFVVTRNLHAADGLAVEELLKVASVLLEALTLAAEDSTSVEEFEPDATVQAAKRARSLVGEITEISARLNGLLRNESVDSEERGNVLQYLNSVTGSSSGDDGSEADHIGSSIARILDSTNSAVERLDKQCKIMISNQRGMEEKIRKKTIDLERTLKRLEGLKHVRPAYMDEYEQLEVELQVEYEQYVVHLRNVDYLEGELMSFKQAAIEKQNKTERSMKRMQKKFREEELRILIGGDDYETEATSFRADGDATSSVNPKHSRETDNALGRHVDKVSRIDASVTGSTPRDNASFSRSEGSPSEPSSGGGNSFEGSEGSETSGSLILDDDDSDDNF
ncbi:hypothetical protein ACHAXR_004226 [Thalassiosira sp. AJA248-18]